MRNVREIHFMCRGWALDHTSDPWVTLEVGETPESQMIQQLATLRQFMTERDDRKARATD